MIQRSNVETYTLSLVPDNLEVHAVVLYKGLWYVRILIIVNIMLKASFSEYLNLYLNLSHLRE